MVPKEEADGNLQSKEPEDLPGVHVPVSHHPLHCVLCFHDLIMP